MKSPHFLIFLSLASQHARDSSLSNLFSFHGFIPPPCAHTETHMVEKVKRDAGGGNQLPFAE
jgi:hypothetical protein